MNKPIHPKIISNGAKKGQNIVTPNLIRFHNIPFPKYRPIPVTIVFDIGIYYATIDNIGAAIYVALFNVFIKNLTTL